MVLRFLVLVCCLFFSKSVNSLESCKDDETFSFGFTNCSNCGGVDFCKKAKTRNPFCKTKYKDTATKVKKKGKEWCPKTCNPDCRTKSPTTAPTKLCMDRHDLRFKHNEVWYTCNTLPSKKSKLKKLCKKKKKWKGGSLKGKHYVRAMCPETCGYVCPTPSPSQPPTVVVSSSPSQPSTVSSVPSPSVSSVPSFPVTSSPVSMTTAVVTLGASGVDTVVPSGDCPATVTKELLIDGSAFTHDVAAKAPVTLVLYQCSSVGFDPMKIKLIGFQEGLWFEIVTVGTKVNLVVKSLTDYSEYFWGSGYSGDYPFQVAQGHYPAFKWDTVPKWISYRKKPNRADSKFTPDEIRSIAETNDMSWYGQVPVDEIVEVADALKIANPDFKQLLYWNSNIYWSEPIPNFNEEWLKHKMVNGQRWYLIMENNKLVYREDTTNERRFYNHTIPAMRQWWIDHAVMMTSKSSIDGIFVDSTRSNIGTDWSNMIEQLMNTLPEDVIKMGNFLRQRDSYRADENGKNVPHNGNRWRMPYSDGSYLENVHNGPVNQPKGQSLIASMQLSREALWKGKIIMWNGAPFNCAANCEVTEEEMAEYIKPTLAEYLILAEKYSYFNFYITPVANDNPAWMWNTGSMDEFKRPLGRPLGPPVKVGNKFTRHFEHVAVMLTVGDDGVNTGTYVGAEWT